MNMHCGRFFCLLLIIVLSPDPRVLAQSAEGEFSQWEQAIHQAERLLEERSEDAGIETLESLRQRLARQREEAQAIVASDSIHLRTLEAQLRALGPAPADGESEPADRAERRRTLQKRIATAKEPLVAAEEIVLQSDVLISELDTLIRRKSASALLVRSPSPIDPAAWLPAARELGDALTRISKEITRILNDGYARSLLKDRLPLALFLGILGLFTLTFGRSHLLKRLHRRRLSIAPPGRFNWPAIMINLTHLVLPVISISLLLGGFYLLHLDLFVVTKTLYFLPLIAMVFIIGNWLGKSLFSPKSTDTSFFELDAGSRVAGYRCMLLLSLVLSLEITLQLFEIDYNFTPQSEAVLTLPITIAGCFTLWRLSSILLLARTNLHRTPQEDIETTTEAAILLALSLLLRTAAVLAALFIILGFTALSREILAPMILTVALLGLALFFFHVLSSLLEPIAGRGEEKKEPSRSFLPIIILVVIGLVTAPLLALAWGMRWSTVVEIWWALNEGVKIGETRISLDIVLLLLVVFLIGLSVTRWLQKIFRLAILPRTRLDIGGQSALVTGIGYAGITMSALIAISSAGLDLSSLAILVGALSVGIGFGLQTIASNFISGIILLIERPIKEGDWIDVSGHSGYVRKISVRSTRVETFDRHDVIIPNSDLIAGVVKNMTLTGMTGRIIMPVGIAYGSDVEEARSILLEIAEKHAMVLSNPQPVVLFVGFGDSSINLELRCFIADVNSMLSVRSDIFFSIYAAFADAGIEIPFPQRVVTMKQTE